MCNVQCLILKFLMLKIHKIGKECNYLDGASLLAEKNLRLESLNSKIDHYEKDVC